MNHWTHQVSATCLLLFAAMFVCGESAGQDSAYRVYVDESAAVMDGAEFLLVQTQPDTVPAQPEEPPRTAAVRRRQRTYRLPPMFGDIFGGSTYQAFVQPPDIQFNQVLIDGQGGFDFFVVNDNGGNGADPNPAVAIMVQDRNQGGIVIASSIAAGTGPAGQPNSYPISEPDLPGVSPPPPPGPGTFAYSGGNAVYIGMIDTNPVGDGENWSLNFGHTFTPDPILINIPVGGAVGREKIAENNSPEPRARYFWNYSFYNDVFGGIGDVNRNSFGIEQPLGDGMASVSVRIPFAGTLDVDQISGGPVARNTQFGDLTFIGKVLLTETDDYLVSAGLGLTVPTAEGSRVFAANGDQIMSLDHQSVRLLPFLACMHGYDSGWYWQSFLQLDVPTNGDPVSWDQSGANPSHVGVLQEPTLLFLDVGVGHWIVGGPQAGSGIAATAELHYATTLQDADTIVASDLVITSAVNRYDLLNLTMGLNVALNERVSIRPAMVIPLNDDQFDYEAMVQANVWR